MFELGIFVLAFIIGMLSGIAMVWDKRFNDGRRYGYELGCEVRRDRDSLARSLNRVIGL